MKIPLGPGSERRCVVAYLYGGLGNQLFQYAAGRSLANRLGVELILDAGSYRRPGEQRRYALEPFAIVADVVESDRLPSPSLERDDETSVAMLRRWLGDQARLCTGWDSLARHAGRPGFSIFRERAQGYDPRFTSLRAPVALVGYWQSPKYFASIAATIREHCRLTSEVGRESARWLEAIEGAGSVCLHVRRGDFLYADQRHRPPSMGYYIAAMAHMRERIESPRFFVFSDDWPWVHRHLAGTDVILVDANGPENAAEELRLMAACRHHIIANSTLSWWAAWLADWPSQTAIAPDPWFYRGRATPDLLPDGWIKLSRD